MLDKDGEIGSFPRVFTGIVQDVGRIVAIEKQPEQTLIQITTALDMSDWRVGDSVAVDGCCLTITAFPRADAFAAALSLETLKQTRFSEAEIGWKVNLEPALRLGDALGGHWVSGHVDGLGEVVSIRKIGEHREVCFAAPSPLGRYIVVKGSVAVNGVSLTVNRIDGDRFTVNLIPHTLAHTNLGELQEGERVNLETDLLGRYVERLLSYQSNDPTIDASVEKG